MEAFDSWRQRCMANKQKSEGLEVTGDDKKLYTLGGEEPVERRHFFGLCPACFKIGEHSACSGCLMVSYCNRDCQKKDWKGHKELCKLVQKMRGKNPGKTHLFHKKPESHGQFSQTLKQCLGRDLTQYESDVLVHPRLCAVCLEGDQSLLHNCLVCHCMAYCGKDCEEEDKDLHEQYCHILKQCIVDYRYSILIGHEASCFSPPFHSTYTPLPGSIHQLLQEHVQALLNNQQDLDYRDSEVRNLSFQYTCPLTVLYAGEVANTPRGPIHQAKELVIHLVGARQQEIKQALAWTVIATRLPLLEKLSLVMVGPEVGAGDLPSTFTLRANNAVVRYIVEPPCPYHKYAKRKSFIKPDIVAALNCGFIFYKEWDASLDSLVAASGAPLVFTEYYLMDCQLNLDKLKEHTNKEIQVIMAPARNPQCSEYAARIPAGFAMRQFQRGNVLMSNDFICIVKCKK